MAMIRWQSMVRTLAGVLCLSLPVPGQQVQVQVDVDVALRGVSHVVVPQSFGFPLTGRQGIRVDRVDAHVKILGQTASTTLEVTVSNPGSGNAEAVLLLPVPDGAVVSSFLFDGAAKEPTAKLLERDEARRLYDSIVARVRDPALLEFAGYNLVRSSVFPVPSGGGQRVRLTYEHVLPADGARVDYVLPRSESLTQRVPWRFFVDLQSKVPVATVYSPTHELNAVRVGDHHLTVQVLGEEGMEPGHFRLSYLREGKDVTASLFAYPDPKVGGGYFLLIAGLPPRTAEEDQAIRREVTLVIDRSGSMAGPKMEQVRAAALQILGGLNDGEAFNIIDYSTTVQSFAARPVLKDKEMVLQAKEYLDGLRTTGGTNIHDALVEALRQPPMAGTLPLVLFLTDGLPTVGQTSETAIRKLVETGNPHHRRLFTFGVGEDVNVPLLDGIADLTRATTTYVRPDEDVELKVAQTFRRLKGPLLADAVVEALDDQGLVSTRRVGELIPAPLPDLFEGDQLVLLGQYRDAAAPLRLRLSGNYLGQPRRFAFDFDLAHATTRNAFVPRLWASRRINYLVDQVRQLGAAQFPPVTGAELLQDPRFRELRDEILRLSTEFGILSEYTSFLATEGTDLNDWAGLVLTCGENLDHRAVRQRFGLEAVNQGINFNGKKVQSKVDYHNRYWNEKSELVQVAGVQQVCDKAFFRRGARWVDSALVTQQSATQADEVVAFGSERHRQLLAELVAEGRQGVLSMSGEILLAHRGRNVLIDNGVPAEGRTP